MIPENSKFTRLRCTNIRMPRHASGHRRSNTTNHRGSSKTVWVCTHRHSSACEHWREIAQEGRRAGCARVPVPWCASTLLRLTCQEGAAPTCCRIEETARTAKFHHDRVMAFIGLKRPHVKCWELNTTLRGPEVEQGSRQEAG